MNKYFINCDLNNFWSDNEYAKNYQFATVTYDLIEAIHHKQAYPD
ncbi:hypothetical protein [Nostoc sp. FACHB-190]|nr:hypothetical protein [Nostoc sp. FACHB-190]